MELAELRTEVQRRYLLSHMRTYGTRKVHGSWIMLSHRTFFFWYLEESPSFSKLTIMNLLRKGKAIKKVKTPYHCNNFQVL